MVWLFCKTVGAHDLIMNIVSMCIFPFVGQYLFKGVMQISDDTYVQVLEARKKSVSQFIINAIKC